MSDSNKTPTRRIFSRPIFEIIGLISSIIALPLSVYFYVESIQRPDLTISRNPSKLEVINAGTSSKLSVTYNGKQISSDVSIAQLALWNQGKKPIKTEEDKDILESIVIHANPEVEILQATVIKTSRNVIQFGIETNQLDQGRVPVKWKVLEQGDGGVIEIIYLGAPDVEFDVDGVILGQKNIERYSNTLGFKSPEEEFEVYRAANRRRQLFFLPLSFLSFIGFIFALYKTIKGSNNPKDFNNVINYKIIAPILAVLLLIMTVLAFYTYVLSKYPMPPPNL